MRSTVARLVTALRGTSARPISRLMGRSGAAPDTRPRWMIGLTKVHQMAWCVVALRMVRLAAVQT